MSNTVHPPAIAGLSEIAPHYRALLCDVWGVVHDGMRAFPAAGEALGKFREGGGRVVLITNAPRPKAEVVRQLDRFGLPGSAYDDVITSGEASRDFLRERPGIRVFHVGPERDLPLYDGLDIHRTGLGEAQIVVCTGLFDDEAETPDDYLPRFAEWHALGLPMLCANPDVIVERGPKLVWCAGALAERYAALGGEVVIVGKPHAPIYAAALAMIGRIMGAEVPKSAILAIGDGLATDVRGATQAGLDVLFVAAGIHAAEFEDPQHPDPETVSRVLLKAGLAARAFVPRLAW